jgi:hypothetical protein
VGYSYTLGEGITNLSLQTTDVVGNSSAVQTWQAKIDRTPPVLQTPTGSLWDHRHQSVDHRSEGLYGSDYQAQVVAGDGDPSSNASARSGVHDVHFQVLDASGNVVVDSPDPSPQGCTGQMSSCAKTRSWDWQIAPSLPDGTYTVSVSATDQAGNVSSPLTWTVVLNRQGDIYDAQEWEGDPSTGAPMDSEQWGRIATQIGRTQAPDVIVTRDNVSCNSSDPNGCAQRRLSTQNTGGQKDAYEVTTGSSSTDPGVPPAADILIGPPQNQSPMATAPLMSELQPWQYAPPAHGDSAAEYQVSETDPDTNQPVTANVWFDTATNMPVNQTVTSAGSSYTYAVSRLQESQVSSDFFAVGPPSNKGHETDVDHDGSSPMSSATDRSTGEAYTPYYVGSSISVVGSGVFCLDTTDLVNFETDSAPSIPQQDPTIEAAQPAPALQTMVDSSYALLPAGTACSPGSDTAGDPDLQVMSYDANSVAGQQWLTSYQAEAQGIQLDPQNPDFARGGVVPIALPQPTTAYIVPVSDSQETALMQLGSSIVVIQGQFDRNTLQVIAGDLVQG